MTSFLDVRARDPIVCRDGRPFGANQGNRMKSLAWPLPAMIAGSCRALIANTAGRDFSLQTGRELLGLEIAGLFPVADRCLYLPAPNDCVVHPDKGPLRAAPAKEHGIELGGCDWPNAGLRPVALSESEATEDFKPEFAPAWWPMAAYERWMAGGPVSFDSGFLKGPDVEYRAHVSLNAGTGSAEEGELFTTAALPLAHLRRHCAKTDGGLLGNFAEIELAGRVRATGWCEDAAKRLDTLHPLGGERRLAHWKASKSGSIWNCPVLIRNALAVSTHVRMVLATPGIFRDGWKPGWLDGDLIGTPPSSKVKLRLVGVTIQRWQAVSGWSLVAPTGPKPVKRMVPAGGAYFFEKVDGDVSSLADQWLEPVSDDSQDKRDGFGLATWGSW